MTHATRIALATTCLSLAACMPVGGLSLKDDTGLEGGQGALVFEPTSLDFGDVTIGAVATAELTLSSQGEGAATLASLALEGGDFALLDAPSLPLEIAPEGPLTLTVAYEPGDEGMHGGVLIATPKRGEVVTAALMGSGAAPGWIEDPFELNNPPVDLLFLADQSGSMADDNASLAATFSVFIRALEAVTNDWRILVVNDDDGCARSGVLTPATPGYEDLFQADIRSGGGAWTEALLTLAARALENTDPGDCNEGFLRDEALLHVITTSDEPEQSVEPWSSYVAAVQAAKPHRQQARISAVAGDYPGGCGGASAGAGYYEAVQATEGVFLSVCDPWTDNVELLAEASAWQWRLDLSATPVVETIQLWVDGDERSEGWHYDPELEAVLFDTGFPKPGRSVVVGYEAVAG
jgi:hypothetical protein